LLGSRVDHDNNTGRREVFPKRSRVSQGRTPFFDVLVVGVSDERLG